MSGEFLEMSKEWTDGMGQSALAHRCWPEILALVKAAEHATYRWEEGPFVSQMDADDAIVKALDAIDEKAKTL